MGILDKFYKKSKDSSTPNFTAPQIFLASVLSVGGVFAAAISLGSRIELGAGVRATDDCAETPVVSFDQDFVTTMTGNPSRLTGVTVTGIPVSCANRYYRLNLYNSNRTLLESIVWRAVLVSSNDTAIRARADGSTTTNRSESGTSTVFPSSETNPLGLVLQNVDPAQIDSFLLESSEEVLSEED